MKRVILILALGVALTVGASEYKWVGPQYERDIAYEGSDDTLGNTADSGWVYFDLIGGSHTCIGYVLVGTDHSGNSGLGNSDSIICQIISEMPNGDRNILAADTAADMTTSEACTLGVTIDEDEGDTLLTHRLGVFWNIVDTCSDTTITGSRTITPYLILK